MRPLFRVFRPAFTLPAVLSLAGPAALAAGPRNVVLFIADDMGQDAGCYGNRDVQTPALDQLAREGTRFRNAFCTSASCSASRSVLMTGLQNHATGHYGHAHAAHHFSTYRSIRSLPVILGENGYRTGRIGKYHLAPEEVYRFETAIPGNAWNPVGMANAARDFIADRSRPFFLYFCTLTPHRSGGTLAGHPLKPNPFGNHQQYPEINDVTYRELALTVPPHLPDLPETRAELAQYYQAISRTDAGLARLVALLQFRPRYELYDLQADPHELTNLDGVAAHRAVFDDLAARLKAYQQKTRDPWLSKYTYE